MLKLHLVEQSLIPGRGPFVDVTQLWRRFPLILLEWNTSVLFVENRVRGHISKNIRSSMGKPQSLEYAHDALESIFTRLPHHPHHLLHHLLHLLHPKRPPSSVHLIRSRW